MIKLNTARCRISESAGFALLKRITKNAARFFFGVAHVLKSPRGPDVFHDDRPLGEPRLDVGFIDQFFQIFARLEIGNLLGRHLHRFTGAGIAAYAAVTAAKLE